MKIKNYQVLKGEFKRLKSVITSSAQTILFTNQTEMNPTTAISSKQLSQQDECLTAFKENLSKKNKLQKFWFLVSLKMKLTNQLLNGNEKD